LLSAGQLICIVALKNDLHALAVSKVLNQRMVCECHIVESDRIAQRNTLSLRIGRSSSAGACLTSTGDRIHLSNVTVLWLRRPRAPQILDHAIDDPNARVLIDNDSSGGLRGLLTTTFTGKWISSFDSLIRGSDKITQLHAAAQCGMRVPATLVTQSQYEVAKFYEQHSGRIIIKTIAGAEGPFLLTRQIHDPFEFDEASYAAAPAIYQELIQGIRHIRLICFGETSLAASIDSPDLDWRPNLNVPIQSWPVPEGVHRKVRRTLDYLGLEMGVIDLKETPDGELVWLEVNPQGQFLFLEPLTGLNIAEQFADYLIRLATAPKTELKSGGQYDGFRQEG
jgi:hypothetical protein